MQTKGGTNKLRIKEEKPTYQHCKVERGHVVLPCVIDTTALLHQAANQQPELLPLLALQQTQLGRGGRVHTLQARTGSITTIPLSSLASNSHFFTASQY